jgi:hypothetical protein
MIGKNKVGAEWERESDFRRKMITFESMIETWG